MNIIKPEKLKRGDTLAVIAPCGNVDTEKINIAVKYLENQGYKVKVGSNTDKNYRYMAGFDEERLEDLSQAFADKEVKGIICARGGYGALRLIDRIDYSIIQNNPKIFCGYSDVTALSAMILKNTGLITFSGPMAQSDFVNPESFTCENFWETLKNTQKQITADNLKYIKKAIQKVFCLVETLLQLRHYVEETSFLIEILYFSAKI